MKPVVVFQSLSKFGDAQSVSLCFFLNWQRKQNFQKKGRRTTLKWNMERGKEMLIKEMFQLIYKENIEETKEVLRNSGRLSLPL